MIIDIVDIYFLKIDCEERSLILISYLLSSKGNLKASNFLLISTSFLRGIAVTPAVLPKHTLFKVLYFILEKLKNYTLFILIFSQIL